MPTDPTPFAERLTERSLNLNTRLCLGLDPRLDAYVNRQDLRRHTLEVLDACAPYVACIKPQVAFYEALGVWGMQVLEEVCFAARSLGLPVIVDAKRGDIGSTAAAYAQAWLGGNHAGDALTVNPFLGFETLTPFLDAAEQHGGAVFVLVKTSNPGQADLQGGGISEKVAAEVAHLGAEQGQGLSNVGAVIGATHPQELAVWRRAMPQAPLLLPGLGAQGARAADLAPAFMPGGLGAVVSASRGIQYASGLNVAAAHEAARMFRDELNAALS